MTYQLTNVNLRKIIEIVPENNPIKNFEKNCNSFLDYLDSLSGRVERKAISCDQYRLLTVKYPRLAPWILETETNNEIELIYTLSSFKAYRLTNSILDLLNKDELYVTMPLARTFLETSCSCYYYILKLKELVDKMNENVCFEKLYRYYSSEREELTMQALKGTKSELMLVKDKDAREAVQVLKFVDFAAREKGFDGIRTYYNQLCEFTHPNMGSNQIFGIITPIANSVPTFHESERMVISPAEIDLFYREIPEENKFEVYYRYSGTVLHTISLGISLLRKAIETGKKLKVKPYAT